MASDHGRRRRGGHARREHVAALQRHASEDCHDLFIRLAGSVDYLRQAGAKLPVKVDFGVAHFFVGQRGKPRQAFLGGDTAPLDLRQELKERLGVYSRSFR